VAPRDVLTRHHDVAPRLPPEHDRRRSDHVLAAVGEADHSAARVGGDPRFAAARRHQRLTGCLGHLESLNELRAAGATFVHESELVTTHLDLVTVQQRRRLGAEPHPVDEHFRRRRGLADDHLPVWLPLEQGMTWQHVCPGQQDRAGRIAAERHLADGDGEFSPTEL